VEAIVLGMVPRGGLFVPENIPEINLEKIKHMNYQNLAFEILSPYLSGGNLDYTEEEIKNFISSAYQSAKFDNDRITPLHMIDDKTGILELWHGQTAAFKDLALQIMPYFLVSGAKKLNKKNEIVILVATSGDTGKAALEGYKDVPGTQIIVFYPKNGVSRVQELQMLTTAGKNTFVVGVEGNFDDCQTMVKNIFSDAAYNLTVNSKGFDFSSANSINWGRLAPQIVYYFYGYIQMLEKKVIQLGDSVNAVVPTGNFGNILAGYYAREMGLPLNKLICASNKNNILSDFINTGIYNKKRDFYKTSSPSMDILISSNLERFLFEITSHNASKITRWYDDLAVKGQFKVDDSTKQRLKKVLFGAYSGEDEVYSEIKNVFEKSGYLIDTHTAVGVSVYEKYKAGTGDELPAFICGTASPFKFNRAVYEALTGDHAAQDEFAVLKKLSEYTQTPVHRALEGLDVLPQKREVVIKKTQGKEAINKILKI
jgi:threonine synthase